MADFGTRSVRLGMAAGGLGTAKANKQLAISSEQLKNTTAKTAKDAKMSVLRSRVFAYFAVSSFHHPRNSRNSRTLPIAHCPLVTRGVLV
jgi:hypothetical protein